MRQIHRNALAQQNTVKCLTLKASFCCLDLGFSGLKLSISLNFLFAVARAFQPCLWAHTILNFHRVA